MLEGKKEFSDSACAAVTSAPGQGLQQRAAAVRNAKRTVSAKNISSLGTRSQDFVTSHFLTFKNWPFNFAVSSFLLLTPSCFPLTPPNSNQCFHAAGVCSSCPPTQAHLCRALVLRDLCSWCNCPVYKETSGAGFVRLKVLVCRAPVC